MGFFFEALGAVNSDALHEALLYGLTMTRHRGALICAG
jgi:hypothetical protein